MPSPFPPLPPSSSSPTKSTLQIPRSTHLNHLRHTIRLAQQSPPKPTNFCVGCVIVSYPTTVENPGGGQVLSTGYTLELPGNTHAEQCALEKLSSSSSSRVEDSSSAAVVVVLYTSLEPCSKRLSGATPCVQRIISSNLPDSGSGGGNVRIDRVVFGAKEPGTFVQNSQSCRLLTEAGVPWEYVDDLEQQILEVAMAGHHHQHHHHHQTDLKKEEGEDQSTDKVKETRIDDITEEERQRQAALPKNPKKRMMDVPPPPPPAPVSESETKSAEQS